MQAEFTARLVNELSQEIQKVLLEHPLNIERRRQVRHGIWRGLE